MSLDTGVIVTAYVVETLAKAIASELHGMAPLKVPGGSQMRQQWLGDILAVQAGFHAIPGGMDAFHRAMDEA